MIWYFSHLILITVISVYVLITKNIETLRHRT